MSRKYIDIRGQRFGRLIALHPVEARNRGMTWLCKCDCRNSKVVLGTNLRKGLTQSCGCLHKERTAESSRTHGKTGTKIYGLWNAMIMRCTNPKVKAFKNYGGRGIKVCHRWRQFENFLADMGNRPKGTTLDRENNYGDYSPENCRWATSTEQANNKTNNRLLVLNGKIQTVAQWAKETKIPSSLIRQRIDRDGKTVEEALHP